MSIQQEIYGTILILTTTFFGLSLLKRFYQLNLSISKEKLFFDDWNFFESRHQQNSELAVAFLKKKTQDILQKFRFYRWLFFFLWLTAITLVIMPIELITDYFKIGLNISFSSIVIYASYLIWHFTNIIGALKKSKQNIAELDRLLS